MWITNQVELAAGSCPGSVGVRSEMTIPSQADSSFERNRKGVAHRIR
jgi:hypothetical protein